ncbi:cryptochrome/photolyase family protein [Nesterenkonia muleiensis]|uniref:cryptochrome/photolyase family protein n=1 Tax=Nesterenkonia muleiensis TaxID=2282648 RepID=UPI000E7632D0|nr:deoxyribodipyrimidine photo-lyase [Nesterenkonia muleiensis]
MSRTLVWFRDDLRVQDHPALMEAVHHAEGPGDVVGLYVLDDASPGIRPLGGAARWWLHHALSSLREDLASLGVPLLIRSGDPQQLLPELATACAAERVYWSRRYGGDERTLDAAIKSSLPEHGVATESFAASVLREPWTVQTTTGGPYKVFTPFWNALSALDFREPLAAPEPLGDLGSATARLAGAGVRLGEPEELELLPRRPDWAAGLRLTWDATEVGGHRRLHTFVEELGAEYDDARDIPSTDGTSRLSPYLRFGQLSPFQVWHAAASIGEETSRRTFRSELGWREFCWHLLYHFPQLPHTNLRAEFDHYPWQSRQDAPEEFHSWTSGTTGIPLVDAGMRELWETGHMHNRVRMITASFLVKNLGIDWREGEAWFWDTLVDADAASNPANWQWVAGCGMDAAPYFRIFNPERQRERFDPQNAYTEQWVPELNTGDYPEPIVDLKASRAEALEHYKSISGR